MKDAVLPTRRESLLVEEWAMLLRKWERELNHLGEAKDATYLTELIPCQPHVDRINTHVDRLKEIIEELEGSAFTKSALYRRLAITTALLEEAMKPFNRLVDYVILQSARAET